MLKGFAERIWARKAVVVAVAAAIASLWAAGTPPWLAAAVPALVGLVCTLPFRRDSAEVAVATPQLPPLAVDPLAEVKAAFAGFDSPAYLLDGDENVLYQNAAARHAFGEVEPGRHISARVRAPAVLEMIRRTIATGENGQTEYSVYLPAESVYMVRMIPARGTGTGIGFYVLIFRDISEARRIDRMRQDFVANASHELRTPLASLRGFIETLLGPARDDPQARTRFLPIMLDQVNRMSRLVDDLLSLSRLEATGWLAPDSSVDLVPLVHSVCDALAPLAAGLDVEILRHLPAEPVIVRGDADELTQVFENLIENACKYGQEGKRVEVRLGVNAAGEVEASVTDFGPGIPSEQVPRLTERFYRVNVESSQSKKGTGLGLAIVKHILTRHKARLIIKSELGKGSTFTVRF